MELPQPVHNNLAVLGSKINSSLHSLQYCDCSSRLSLVILDNLSLTMTWILSRSNSSRSIICLSFHFTLDLSRRKYTRHAFILVLYSIQIGIIQMDTSKISYTR